MFVVQRQLLIRSRELQHSVSLLRGITEGTTDAVFVKDLQGRYLMINSAGAAFAGRSVDEIWARPILSSSAPDTAEVVMEKDRQVLMQGVTQTFEESGTANGVSRIYLSTKGPYRDAMEGSSACLGWRGTSQSASGPRRKCGSRSKSCEFTLNIRRWRWWSGIWTFEWLRGTLRRAHLRLFATGGARAARPVHCSATVP